MKVEIVLTNTGERKWIEQGTQVAELAAEYTKQKTESDGKAPWPILGALVNNKVEHLQYRIYNPKTIHLLDITSRQGFRMYRNALTMMLYTAVHDCYPKATLSIDHSMQNGFYCRITSAVDDFVLPDPMEVCSTVRDRMIALQEQDIPLDFRLVYDFATTAPLDKIRFIEQTRTYNMNAAREALKGNYGHNLGKTIDRPLAKGIFGNSIYSHIIARTASACDARMGGAMIPVMSNSGSGNQGICATNPVCVYAKENENTEEELIRALMLSHLTAIYIKQSLGTLSALCGCVVASIGASCGITYLMGGSYERICFSVKNMIANLTGMICDGAKPACSLKITSGVSTALLSALLAMEGKCVSPMEGIIDDSVDKSISNLTSIGADAMCKTDDMVMQMMITKDQ